MNQILNAAQKAWATRRARLQAEKATIVSSPAAPARRKRQLVDRIGALVIPQAVEKTAGQKAAETRAAVEAARQEIALLKTGIAESSALAEFSTVRMWVDDVKVGCGVRNFVVVEIGPRIVRLFNAPTLREIEVDRISFDKYAKPYVSKAGAIARIIEATAACYDRLDLDYAPRIVRQALAAASR